MKPPLRRGFITLMEVPARAASICYNTPMDGSPENADCGLRIADCHGDLAPQAENPKSKIQNPKSLVPTWDHEIQLCALGNRLVAGVDEAGRGAWAGPLVAGAVILPHPDELARMPEARELASELATLRDSKMLTPHVREHLLEVIRAIAVAMGTGSVSPALVDVIGLGPANRLAMARAVRALGVPPDHLLIDAFRIRSMPLPQRPIIKGDATCMSIAAASVLAKVTRDHFMQRQDEVYPGYGFGKHKGYGTREHVEALLQHGVSPIHRRSYAPIRAMLAGQPWALIEQGES